MQVETFECSETAAEPIEATEEAIRLMEELGLDGQIELIAPRKEESDRDRRCPYREMLAEERFVYGVLCPQKFKVKEYNASPIPLRVLQVGSHAMSLGIFNRLEVWDKASVTVKDPVLVAHTGGEYDWKSKVFILARWGEVLEPFAVLLQRAVAAKRQEAIESAEAVLAEIRGATTATLVQHGADSLAVWK